MCDNSVYRQTEIAHKFFGGFLCRGAINRVRSHFCAQSLSIFQVVFIGADVTIFCDFSVEM